MQKLKPSDRRNDDFVVKLHVKPLSRRGDRFAAAQKTKEQAIRWLDALDERLASFGGRRLSDPTAFGTVNIEVDAAAVSTIMALPFVDAVYPNQKVMIDR